MPSTMMPNTMMPSPIESRHAILSFEAALEARRPMLAAMPESEITRRFSLDLVVVSAMASRAASAVSPHRGVLVARFGAEAVALLDGLDTSARAARQAHVEVAIAEEPSELAGVHEELIAAYRRLVVDADSLVIRGFLRKERLARSRDVKGYQRALQSLLGVLVVFRDSWSEIEAHTPVVVADLDRADRLCTKMADALARRHQRGARAAAVETRTRALSLLVREYGELRRLVSFVRWFDGDADRIVPSLYAGRGGRRKKRDAEPSVDVEDETPTPLAGPFNGGPPFTA